MDLLIALRAFRRVVESGSFSAVAREMGTTQPAVSRQVAALEDHFGVRLLQRTTRALSLTDDGRDLLTHAERVLDAVEEAESAIGTRRAAPSGLVRIACSTTFGRLYLAPRLPDLLAHYPALEIELSLSDAFTDLVHTGIDLAIRIGEVADTALVARRIGSTARIVAASADYVSRHGAPETPADLAAHPCVIFTPAGTLWRFDGPDGSHEEVLVTGRFRTDSGEAVREGVRHGLGIAFAPAWLFRDELIDGSVVTLLPAWRSARLPVSAVYPSRRHLSPRTRAVIDFLADEFRIDPVISSYGEVPAR